MKPWSSRRTLMIGLAVLVITNAVAMLGVMWNRAGTPESTLQLTQRELQIPYWMNNRESSGVALNLRWQTLPKANDDQSYWNNSGPPSWLDREKLQSLGFDMARMIERAQDNERSERILSKDVLLVLELDGPAYREYLQRVRRHARDAELKRAAAPAQDNLKRQAENAKKSVTEAETENTRLFVVDAGLDLASLRAKYPDRAHYAIVHGQVRPRVYRGKDLVVEGYVEAVSNSSVNVPFEHRATFESSHGGSSARKGNIAATIAFGQRLEPWIVELSASATGGTVAH